MNENSIYVSNGKVIGDSAFYLLANDLLSKECKRLCDFTDALDKEPTQKKERIGGLKFAKACLDEAWQRRGEVIE